MTTTYQVWDDDTGNRVATFATLDEATQFLREMLDTNGEAGVRDLAVVAYLANDADPITVLEGADYLSSRTSPQR